MQIGSFELKDLCWSVVAASATVAYCYILVWSYIQIFLEVCDSSSTIVLVCLISYKWVKLILLLDCVYYGYMSSGKLIWSYNHWPFGYLLVWLLALFMDVSKLRSTFSNSSCCLTPAVEVVGACSAVAVCSKKFSCIFNWSSESCRFNSQLVKSSFGSCWQFW